MARQSIVIDITVKIFQSLFITSRFGKIVFTSYNDPVRLFTKFVRVRKNASIGIRGACILDEYIMINLVQKLTF